MKQTIITTSLLVQLLKKKIRLLFVRLVASLIHNVFYCAMIALLPTSHTQILATTALRNSANFTFVFNLTVQTTYPFKTGERTSNIIMIQLFSCVDFARGRESFANHNGHFVFNLIYIFVLCAPLHIRHITVLHVTCRSYTNEKFLIYLCIRMTTSQTSLRILAVESESLLFATRKV